MLDTSAHSVLKNNKEIRVRNTHILAFVIFHFSIIRKGRARALLVSNFKLFSKIVKRSQSSPAFLNGLLLQTFLFS